MYPEMQDVAGANRLDISNRKRAYRRVRFLIDARSPMNSVSGKPRWRQPSLLAP